LTIPCSAAIAEGIAGVELGAPEADEIRPLLARIKQVRSSTPATPPNTPPTMAPTLVSVDEVEDALADGVTGKEGFSGKLCAAQVTVPEEPWAEVTKNVPVVQAPLVGIEFKE